MSDPRTLRLDFVNPNKAHSYEEVQTMLYEIKTSNEMVFLDERKQVNARLDCATSMLSDLSIQVNDLREANKQLGEYAAESDVIIANLSAVLSSSVALGKKLEKYLADALSTIKLLCSPFAK